MKACLLCFPKPLPKDSGDLLDLMERLAPVHPKCLRAQEART